MQRASCRAAGRTNFRFLLSAALAWPLLQAAGCSLLDPQNLIRMGFGAFLDPINDQVFGLFATLAAGL